MPPHPPTSHLPGQSQYPTEWPILGPRFQEWKLKAPVLAPQLAADSWRTRPAVEVGLWVGDTPDLMPQQPHSAEIMTCIAAMIFGVTLPVTRERLSATQRKTGQPGTNVASRSLKKPLLSQSGWEEKGWSFLLCLDISVQGSRLIYTRPLGRAKFSLNFFFLNFEVLLLGSLSLGCTPLLICSILFQTSSIPNSPYPPTSYCRS